jgi:GT2 family glycosyltransferase/glycosyltransferase involved in cell wall biosynthesis
VTGVSIVVPVYNALADARRCIESVYSSRTSIEFEVIVVDNGSERDVADWLAEEQKRRPNFKSLRFDQPLGFAGAMNQGVRRAQREYIALLNSDTLVTDGWLDLLAGELEKDPALGIVSPVTNRCGHDVQRDPAARSLEPGDAGRYAAGLLDNGEGRRQVLPEAQRLAFFCVLVRRTLWDQLAGLDESFRTGNFEDDDFCLRARFAGYRMAVVRNAFVFHRERKTFAANRLNHGEWLAGNEAVFGARVSRWSRTLRPPVPGAASKDSIGVIVPVMPGREGGLRDSLASLANQTVRGFETLVVGRAGQNISRQLGEFSSRLRLTALAVAEERGGLAALLNAGLAAASGDEIAFLPAADIYYPFHLEVLSGALDGVDAVYSAWSVAIAGQPAGRRSSVSFPEAEPGIELGDWAPLPCWMHRRAGFSFDSTFGGFSPWAYVLKLRDSVRARYLCRVTCERHPDAASARDAADAERVMANFPVHNTWQQSQRQQFLEGVRQGNWEERLIVSRNDKARRARHLLAASHPNGPASTAADPRELARLRSRLEQDTSAIEPVWRSPAKPDIFLFSILEWTALTQRPHHFAQGLAARGHRVFWVDARLRAPEQVDSGNLARQLTSGIYQLELPAVRGEIYRLEWSPQVLDAMAAYFTCLRAAYGIASAWQLVNFPRWEPLVTLLRRRFQWPVAYDCLDDQQAFAELYGHALGQSEKLLIEGSSKLLFSGRFLRDAYQARRPDAVLIANAADFALFREAKPAGLLDHLPRPIVGFFGAFADWLDVDWMEEAAGRFPDWSFVYIGRESFAQPIARQRWNSFSTRPNVHVFPQAAPEKLAQFLAQMDVCTLPFQDIPVARGMNAVKLYEYLAAGKPVVAASLPETEPLRDLGLIATYRTHEESFLALEQAVQTGANAEAVTLRLQFAARNTWAHRVDQLAAALGL